MNSDRIQEQETARELSTDQKKKKMRRLVAQLAAGLSEKYKRIASSQITRKVLRDPAFVRSRTVFLFIGMDAKGEVNTMPLIEEALKQGKRVAVPLCIDQCNMKAIAICDPEHDLVPGLYDIPEPISGMPEVPPEEIEFVLVPCVTCDQEGNRLGHGRGYYDRFLARTGAYKAVCCYSRLMMAPAVIPMAEYDEKMDSVITDD